MEHKFSLVSFPRENRTTFSALISENFQWKEPKVVFHLHPNRNFRDFLVNGKRSLSLAFDYNMMNPNLFCKKL